MSQKYFGFDLDDSMLIMCKALQNRKTLDHILNDLEELGKEEDEPDFRHRPTYDAYRVTRQIIKTAYTHYVASAPVPAIAPDGDGGVIVEWQSDRRVVRLVVPANKGESAYVYHRGDGPSDIDDSASGLILARQLRSIFTE